MADKIKLPILWSIMMNPEDIKKAVNNDERINQLILKGVFRCRIGSFTRNKYDIRNVVIDPAEPHGLISDLYWDETGWYGDVFIPEIKGWKDLVDNMKDPVLHPLINIDSYSEYRIVHFTIMGRTEVDRNRTYDGLHI